MKRIATSLKYRMHVMMYSGAHLSNVCSLKAISTSPLLWLVWRRSNPKPFKLRIWCLSTRARLRNPRQHFKIMISVAKNVGMKPAKYEYITPNSSRENPHSWFGFFLRKKKPKWEILLHTPLKLHSPQIDTKRSKIWGNFREIFAGVEFSGEIFYSVHIWSL